MNYAEARLKAIRLLNQYSNAGQLIQSNDGNTLDYTLRFPSLFDFAQKEIATTAKYIIKSTSFEQTADTTKNYIEHVLPNDFFKMCRVEIGLNVIPWKPKSRYSIAVNSSLNGTIEVLYYAYPVTIDDTVADTYNFEIDEEAAQAMPFYVASQCLIDDPINKSVSDKLYSMYQGKLMNLTNAVTQGSTSVKNSMFTTDGTNKLF